MMSTDHTRNQSNQSNGAGIESGEEFAPELSDKELAAIKAHVAPELERIRNEGGGLTQTESLI
jgi:hypothetical protein